MRTSIFYIIIMLITIHSKGQSIKRGLRPSDIYRLQNIGDPSISPDGKWVLYSLSTTDSSKDKRSNNLWMISWDGKETVQLTNNTLGQGSPKWSPDGKYISFTATREGSNQIWVLDRRGGEPIKLTEIKGDLTDYVWSPDSKRMVLDIKDPIDTGKGKTPKPYIINKYHFKQDISGYQYDIRNNHLYLFDIALKKLDTLTKGSYNEADPQWNFDGSKIAFVSNHSEDEDKNGNTDIWVIDAKSGAASAKLTTWTGSDISPRWSPDGQSIAYLRSSSDGNYLMYEQEELCIADLKSGQTKVISKNLDRPVANPVWSPDGKNINVLVSDNIEHYIASFDASSGKMNKISGGERSFTRLSVHPNGSLLASMSTPTLPTELYAVENNNIRRITYIQDKFVEPLSFATLSKFTSKSKDGTEVSGLLYIPANSPKEKLPLIFYIHGGPVAQDEYSFDITRQMFAAHGYAVAGVNYRGSNGRGLAYSKAIYADWGNKEVMDILGAADYLVNKGIADPNRLAMSGWSYGGILTDFVIASTNRFKVASSGAGSAMQLSLYGVDQYILQFDNELGQPWKNNNYEKYLKLSYPFLHADRIKTPTQFMAGEKDFNVPAVGSEQMYQALRSQGVPTELLIYPGQFHGFTQPSFIKDRFDRYFTWFDKYLIGK